MKENLLYMRKGLLFAVAVVLFGGIIGVQGAFAQEIPKVEVGGQYTMLRTTGDGDNESFHGFGGIFAYNFHEAIGVDTQFNFFVPKSVSAGGLTVDYKQTQGFFGVKTGMRSEKAGIFAKFRPGFVRDTFTGTAGGSSASTSRNNFAMDFGGVLEVYSSRSLGFRLDVGDTIIRRKGTAADGSTVTDTSNNLQIGVGVMFRF